MHIPDAVPTREDFEKSGGAPEQFDEFLKQWQDRAADRIKVAAEKAATGSLKVRVRGGPGTWRAGQTSVMFPAKAPIINGKLNLPNEPGIRLPIGKVVNVPVRDEFHRACLLADPNLEIMSDNEPTFEEEEAARTKAVETLRASKKK
jgi:hypothetical protein